MTELLEQAIARLKTLPASEQDAIARSPVPIRAIAAMILEELEDEVRWNATFAKSQDILTKLSRELV